MNRSLLYQSVRNGLKVFFPEHAMPTRNCIDVACAVNDTPGISLTQQVLALFPKYAGVGGLWDITDTSTLFNGEGQDITAVGEPVALMLDLTGQENHLGQDNPAFRVVYNGDGVTPDGVDDIMVSLNPLDLSACDKVVAAVGHTKINNVIHTIMRFGPSPGPRFDISLGAPSFTTTTMSTGNTVTGPNGGFMGAFPLPVPNGYGAHIVRHALLDSRSEVWWNGVLGDSVSTLDKGGGTFGVQTLELMVRSRPRTKRALVMGIPVAQPQMSDEDIELIRLWLTEVA